MESDKEKVKAEGTKSRKENPARRMKVLFLFLLNMKFIRIVLEVSLNFSVRQ